MSRNIKNDAKAGKYVFRINGRVIPYRMRPHKTKLLEPKSTSYDLRGMSCGRGLTSQVTFIWEIMSPSVMNFWDELLGYQTSVLVTDVQFPIVRGTTTDESGDIIHAHAYWPKAVVDNISINSEMPLYNGRLMISEEPTITIREVLY